MPSHRPSIGARVVEGPLLWLAVGPGQRYPAGDQAGGDRPGLAEVTLDRPLQREADDHRR